MTLFLLPIQGKVPSALISFQGKCLVANGLDAYASDPFAHGDDSGKDPYGHADTAKECVDNCILGMTKRWYKVEPTGCGYNKATKRCSLFLGAKITEGDQDPNNFCWVFVFF